MLLPRCKIVITSPSPECRVVMFDYVTEMEVVSSTLNFTDTAKVIVPRKLKYKGVSVTEFIKRNYTISIEAGYSDSLETIFKGYVKSVSSGTPIVIECENEVWKLKQIKMPATSYIPFSISKFLAEWMKDYVCKKADLTLPEVKIANDTPLAKVFDYLMTTYPIRFYFRGDVFFGILPNALPLENADIKTIRFKIGHNTISDSLTYTLAEDVKVQVIAKVVTKENKKLEWKEPKDGEGAEVRTILIANAKTESDLKQAALDWLKTFKVDKMSGDFLAFGEPFVRKGDLVYLFDEDHKEQNDKKFMVDAVTYTFGQGGYRQKITLGAEIHGSSGSN